MDRYHFEQGRRYRISYIPAGQRTPRSVDANYLGRNRLEDQAHDFDLRPIAGTSSIHEDSIRTVEDLGPAKYERG